MPCMHPFAAEQRAQLNNVISYHETSDVAGYVAATMTITNRATYLLTASDALSRTYARNEMLVREAQQAKFNIDTSPYRCLHRDDFSDTTLANDAEGIPRPLSMAQTQTKILETSREIVKVRDCNKALTRLIMAKIAGSDARDEQASHTANSEPMHVPGKPNLSSSGIRSGVRQPSRTGNEMDEKACCNI